MIPFLFALLAGTLLSFSARAAEPLTDRQRTVLKGLSRDRYTGRWIDLTTNQLMAMRQRADAYLADLPKHHLPGGLVVSARFADTNRSAVVRYEAAEDSAAWTGLLLSAHTFRYIVSRETNAFGDIRRSLDGIDRLLRVSGKPGYLARFSARADDPAYRPVYAEWGGTDPARNGFGKLAFAGNSPFGKEVWLGGPDRNHYAAVNFGLLTVYQLIRDQAIRSQVSNSVMLMISRLQKDDWRIDDGYGNRTFVSPLLRAALLRGAATIDPAHHYPEYVKQAEQYLRLPPPALLQYSDYAPNVFTVASLSLLSRLELNEPNRKLQFEERLTEVMRQVESHLNPFLVACFVESFRKPTISSGIIVTLQGVMYEFPDPPRWGKPVDQTLDRDLSVIEANGEKWSKFTVQMAQRPPAPFQWADSPYRLRGGHGALVTHPGVDFLTAYWMGREREVIPSEDYVPLREERRTAAPRGTNSTTSASRTNRTDAPKSANSPAKPSQP